MKNMATCGGAILTGLLLLPPGVWAGRPLTIDDADPVDAGQFEFESGAAFEHAPDCKHWDYPAGLTCGLFPGLEMGMGFGGQLEERTENLDTAGTEATCREGGIGDLTIGAKWQFVRSCPLGARHALAPSVKLPTADDRKDLGSGKTDCDLTWIASRAMGGKAGVHVNLGYSWIGGPEKDALHYGVAMDYQILDTVQWVGEAFAEKAFADEAVTAAQLNTGFRVNPTADLTFDIAAGSELSGDAPDFTAAAGLTWAFGFGNSDNK